MDSSVIRFIRNLRDRDAETEEAGINPRKCIGDRGVIEKVVVNDLAQLRIADARRTANDRAHFGDIRRSEARPQHSAAREPRRTEEHDLHAIALSVA